jgi:methionyl-tRNA synthetase
LPAALEPDIGAGLRAQAAALPTAVDAALAEYDLRGACRAITALAEAGNRFIEAEAPWRLAKAAADGDAVAAARFTGVIEATLSACRVAAEELAPFVPHGAARLLAQLGPGAAEPVPAFPRIAG